ncbi:hypothetical protein G9C85_02815 [Halorubellus sp. JP-L1]|uniref:hypothetical protein n=1 Tax=Halorubellus sp. JP-L1 TaxID=2715753 RepID=UPI00140AC70B|nr:hypothetical protein [Halorubellus sp. JP-L1]NHN40569.1 hypothetical protein [Halorubellus sp. JP-L1]
MSRTVLPSGGQGDATTNHEAIRRWAAARDATPARAGPNAEGVLRFTFPDTDRFAAITWSEFFATFERERLAFVYEPTDDASRFYKFVDRDAV